MPHPATPALYVNVQRTLLLISPTKNVAALSLWGTYLG